MQRTGPGDGDISILHLPGNAKPGDRQGCDTRPVDHVAGWTSMASGRWRQHIERQGALSTLIKWPSSGLSMCTWKSAGSKADKKQNKKERNYHYTWDLDDGRPGFVRHTKRDRLKLYFDSDADGLFTKNDELISRAKIKRAFRGLGRGRLLQNDDLGTITAFNTVDPNAPATHGELSADAGLIFTNPDGFDVAVFSKVVLPYLV